MKEIIKTKHAAAPIGPYNQAVLINGFLYTSGQIAIDPETGETQFDSIDIETHRVMKSLEAILKAAKMDFNHVIKASIFISNMDDFSKINHIYGSYFNEETAPARETIQVAKLPKNANVEISFIAYNK
ncbi:Rid family detoxifying hydrolase [Psychroflexus sp. MES1-P1E]|jgi:2-iminobutanoate/2-iminopropanoate deaminase|uniref:Rid family detoxifying hydrolase n=1 Tax=Psychroflexus sp. MES1-P1E TaxID=2058320 RepID=UPI000C7D359C|nr:Rid family detoxifying hydrolase [Psychroflexus sp. MES1-P1E]PKG41531.1 reactive intermediate/imine deaminase [Psychroflexus sp. MES1-P1E]